MLYYYYKIVIIFKLAKGKNRNKINPHKFSQILQNNARDAKILGKVTTFKNYWEFKNSTILRIDFQGTIQN